MSKEFAKTVEWSGYGGYEFRGKPDGFDTASGALHWGTGVGFPSRNIVRVTAEVTGAIPSQATTTILAGTTVVGTDGTSASTVSNTEKLTRATIGLTFQSKKGFFVGVGGSWNMPTQARDLKFTDEDQLGDYYDWQVRIGYHPGVRTTRPAAPRRRPRRRPPPQHTLTVKAEYNPCSVAKSANSCPQPRLPGTRSAARSRIGGPHRPGRWRIQPNGRRSGQPMQEGTVPVTVTATCPDDQKTASDSVNIQVTRPPVKTYTFEDVHFD